jgi:DEAD/DEAH box helicase domain-containing protein
VTTLHPVRSAPRPGTDPDAEGGPASGVLPGADLLASVLAGTDSDEQPVTHVHHVPVRESSTLPWPDWVSPDLRSRLEDRGVLAPWRHQVHAAQLAHAGKHVVVATGTASGK